MDIKSRYWAFLVYPESAREDWKDVLCEMGVVCAVSPLHDRDINPTGEKKKAHYHVLVQFEGPTTYKNIDENICQLINATIPKKVISLRGYYRYLTHQDNPEKAQYDPQDIEVYGGFKLDMTTTEITQYKIQIMEDIQEKNIIEYSDICEYYKDIVGDYDKLDIVTNHTYFFDKYICSRRNKQKQAMEKNNVKKH